MQKKAITWQMRITLADHINRIRNQLNLYCFFFKRKEEEKFSNFKKKKPNRSLKKINNNHCAAMN